MIIYRLFISPAVQCARLTTSKLLVYHHKVGQLLHSPVYCGTLLLRSKFRKETVGNDRQAEVKTALFDWRNGVPM